MLRRVQSGVPREHGHGECGAGDGDGDEEEFEVIDVRDVSSHSLSSQGQKSPGNGITKLHWQPPTDGDRCYACSAGFDLIDRRHWCRSCGRIHCKRCLSLQRKLNASAEPDPIAGTHQPVCLKCYSKEPEQTVGPHRTHTRRFREMRSSYLRRRDEQIRKASANLCRACASASAAFASLSTTLGYDPAWSKVNFCAPEVGRRVRDCPSCGRSFGLLLRKHHCRLCGLIFCDKCLFRSVEVFKTEDGQVKVDVLHPEYERSDSTALLGCERCLRALEVATKLEKRLQSSVSRSLSTGEEIRPETLAFAKTIPPAPAFDQLLNMYPELMQLRQRITSGLARLQNDTHMLETGQGLSGTTGNGIPKAISKHQCDLEAQFSTLAATLQKLKRLKSRPMRPVEERVLRGVTSNMLRAYTDHIGTYRRCRRVISDYLPDEVLDAIRVAVDFEAVKNTMILLKQLALESVAFTELEPLARQFLPVLDMIKQQLLRLHTSTYGDTGPSFEAVEETMEVLIKELIQERPLLAHLSSHHNWPAHALSAWDVTFRQVLDSLEAHATLKASDTLRVDLSALQEGGRRILEEQAQKREQHSAVVEDDWVLL